MAKTKNIYSYPVSPNRIARVNCSESPAHVGALRHAVDFIVPAGTPVKAAADGIVIEIKNDSSIGGKDRRYEDQGNYIEILHPDNEYSEYEHLKKASALVKVGDNVRRGQVIARSGATGWVAHLGPHLHFMVGTYGKKGYRTLEIAWSHSKT